VYAGYFQGQHFNQSDIFLAQRIQRQHKEYKVRH